MLIDLNNKVGLVVGIANEHSIAYGCAEIFREAGRELVITYLNKKAEPHERPLAEKIQASLILPCDVTRLAAFLSRDAGKDITGQVIYIDTGY